MKIGLDWDGTVNADPKVFGLIVNAFLNLDHEVVVTTWRCAPEPERTWPDIMAVFETWGFELPVVYCDGKAKRECYQADVWIDDNPASVVFSLEAAPRFEENPEDYDKDVLRLDCDGFDPVRVVWKQLKPKGHHLISPVNFNEDAA